MLSQAVLVMCFLFTIIIAIVVVMLQFSSNSYCDGFVLFSLQHWQSVDVVHAQLPFQYVKEEDLEGIGMTRPEMRRLKKFYKKEHPQGTFGKLKRVSVVGVGQYLSLFLSPCLSLGSV